jgi:hypothetical protein
MVEHQMIYTYAVINGNNLLTLLAADHPSSCLEWVLLHFSYFPGGPGGGRGGVH